MKIVVSIVNFNTKKLLNDLLKRIKEIKYKNSIEIWVVDNASRDGSLEMLKQEFPEVQVIANKINLGFGVGHNIVFSKTKADYYLVLNPDTLITKNVIDEMVDFMEREVCGIASCKILGFDGSLQPNAGDLPTPLSILNWLLNLEVLGIKSPSFHRNEPQYYENIHEVGWVSGNFMMIKKKVLEEIGHFDEQFFMYFEDADFCFRARMRGFKIMFNPGFSIKHLSGGSLVDPRFVQWKGEYAGLVKFYKKHYGIFAASAVRMLSYVSIILRAVAFAISGKFKYALTYGKIIFDL